MKVNVTIIAVLRSVLAQTLLFDWDSGMSQSLLGCGAMKGNVASISLLCIVLAQTLLLDWDNGK